MKSFNYALVLFLLMSQFSLMTQAIAQTPLPELLKRLKSAPQDTARVILLKNISNEYKDTNSDSAIFFAAKGLQLSQRLNYPYGIALTNGALGHYNASQGKNAIAKKHFLTAAGLFEKLQNQPGIASMHNGLGIMAAKEGSYNEATIHFLQALKIYQMTNNTQGIIQSYIKLGTVNSNNNNLDKALEYFNKGMKLNRQFPVSIATGSLLNNIGIIYAKKNDIKSALRYFLKGLQKTTDPDFSAARLLLLINTGAAYENLGNSKRAAYFGKMALKLVRERNIPDQEVNVLVNMASLLSETKPDSSALLLRQALAITQNIPLPLQKLDVYQAVVDLNKEQTNYREALEMLEKKNNLQDSLFSVQKSKDLASLEANYELANETVRSQQLKLKNDQIEFSQKIMLFISSGISLLLVISIAFYSRTRKLNKELVVQKEELNKLNNFKDKLFSIIGHDLRSPISNIINMLDVFNKNILSAEEVHALAPHLKEQSLLTLEVLDKLLLWGKSHLKGITLNKSIFNVKESIQKNLKLYKNAAAQKNLTLIDCFPEELMIYADPAHVDFVVRNLLANAIKYSHSGGRIELMASPEQLPGVCTIIIKDYGVGIAEESQQAIFELDNLSTAGTADEAGNSIGLMLCKEFIQKNDGTITLKSELGKGTEFYISFPSA